MSMSEAARRLADLRAGPWAALGAHARALLANPDLPDASASLAPIDLTTLRPTEASRRLARKLVRQLRPHWVREIEREDEMELRDSLDEALTVLQLMELAIETRYLSLAEVRPEARRELQALLWSKAARDYLVYYDYIAVRILASRVNVNLGLPPVAAPSVGPGGEVSFAGFLARHAEWTTDPDLGRWLRFLDDYVFENFPDGPAAFRDFLKKPALPSNSAECREHYRALVTGFQRFVTFLSDALGDRAAADVTPYALFYSYWLAKLFGFRREEGGYRRSGVDWSKHVDRLAELLPDADANTRASTMRANQRGVSVLRAAWERVAEVLVA